MLSRGLEYNANSRMTYDGQDTLSKTTRITNYYNDLTGLLDFYHYWQCEPIGVHRNHWVEFANQIFQSIVTYSYRLKDGYIPALLHAKNSLTMQYADNSIDDRLLGVGQAIVYEGPNGEFNGIIDIANMSNSASMTRCFAATPIWNASLIVGTRNSIGDFVSYRA